MKILKRAFLDTLPVLTGYLVLGFGFGIVMKSEGYGILLSLAMSALVYAGSMQYAAVGLFGAGASVLTVAMTAFMVNARHIFYGISMLDKYRGTGGVKPYLIFSLTDETYSLVSGDIDMSREERKKYYLLVSLLDHAYWIVGTLIGALVGALIKFNSEGIEFALTALFVTVFVNQLLTAKKYIPAIIGVGSTLLCLTVFGGESFLIPSMILILVLLSVYMGVKKDEN